MYTYMSGAGWEDWSNGKDRMVSNLEKIFEENKENKENKKKWYYYVCCCLCEPKPIADDEYKSFDDLEHNDK